MFNYHDNWVRELKDETKVIVVHLLTDRNLADMMTKGLIAEVRAKLNKCLMDIAEAVASSSASTCNKVETVNTKSKKVVQVSTKKMVAK